MNKLLAPILVAVAFAQNAVAGQIHFEDFNSTDGGYSVTNSGNPAGPWTWDGVGSWFANGTDNNGAPSHSRLTGPDIVVSAGGAVELSFAHRYSFEGGLWDAGAVFAAVNGGAYTQVLDAAFSQNGYTGFGLIGNHDLNGGEGYNGDSPGYATPQYITSIAALGSFNAGDTISLQFLGAWDEFAKGSEPNWQIDWVKVTDTSAVPEPTTVALLGLGLAGFGFAGRRRR